MSNMKNDLMTIDQLKNIKVEMTKVRNNPALRCKFPDSDDFGLMFVADPGNGYWPANMMTISYQGDEHINLDDYADYGQDAYGSDPIGMNKDGEVMISRVLEGRDYELITDDSVLRFVSPVVEPDYDNLDDTLSCAIRESGFDPTCIVHDGNGNFFNVDAIVLDLVMQTETGKEFMTAKLPRV